MQKWEYLLINMLKRTILIFKPGEKERETVKFKPSFAERPAVDLLTQLGREGWEVCGFARGDSSKHWTLKRPIE